MDQSKNRSIELAGKEIQFPFGYQRRSRNDLLKIFVIENRRSLRGYKRVLLIGTVLFLFWLLIKSLILLILLIPFVVLTAIGLIGYADIWRVRKKWEKEQIPRRAFVKERTLKYGDYGVILREIDLTGQYTEEYAWNRYGFMIEWEKFLFLVPAKEKAEMLIIRADEIGDVNFLAFRDFARSKLRYKEISDYKEII